MKTYYHLPNQLIYNLEKDKFINIEFDIAVKYLKLIYKDSKTFQNQFLLKLENIKDLNAICTALKLAFIQAEVFSLLDLGLISDKNILKETNSYLVKEDLVSDKNNSFFETYVEKMKIFLDQETQTITNEIIIDEFSNFKKVTTIEKYVLKLNEKKILFEISNVDKLIIESEVEEFACQNKNLKSIQLNKELLYLNLNGNEIKEITLNKSLIDLEIAGNNLKELHCNANLKRLFVTNNQLDKLTLNTDLEELICNGNNLKSIELNTNLKVANFLGTQLKYIKINKCLLELNLYHATNENIEIDNTVKNKRVKINYYMY